MRGQISIERQRRSRDAQELPLLLVFCEREEIKESAHSKEDHQEADHVDTNAPVVFLGKNLRPGILQQKLRHVFEIVIAQRFNVELSAAPRPPRRRRPRSY